MTVVPEAQRMADLPRAIKVRNQITRPCSSEMPSALTHPVP